MSRSVRIHEFGGPEVLTIEEVAVPELGATEVRLQVKAIGLNRSEVLLRSGRAATQPVLPTQIGLEAAGLIDAVGSDVKGFTIGDRVAVIPGQSGYHYYGELALAPARTLVKAPDHVSWEAAAATWMAFGTAWGGIIDAAGLSAGQAALITAASSSTGLAAIQVARSIGATPIALTRTSAKKRALLNAGAAHVIATEEQDLVAEIVRLTDGKGAEVAFDAVGGPAFAQLVDAMSDNGKIIVYGRLSPDATPLPVVRVLWKDLSIRGFSLPRVVLDDVKLVALKRFVSEGLASGALRPVIAKTFPFDDIVAAHRYLESGDQIGKVVVTV
jgi:NADPH:quinone reductase-like Zn-dependent oxidoreductase